MWSRIAVVCLAIAALAAVAAALDPAPAFADLGFPAYVPFPPQIRINPDQKLIDEAVAEVDFVTDAAGSETKTLRGRHVFRWFDYKPAAGEPAPGYYNGTEERIFNAMRAPLEKAGWTQIFVAENKGAFTMRRDKDGREAWLNVKMDAPQAQVNAEMIELGAAAAAFVLPPPAARPEKVSDDADLPFLPPPAGSTRTGGGRDDSPMDVVPPGSGGEPMLVGHGVVGRDYQGPSSLSNLQFISDYRRALIAAGWRVLYPASDAEEKQYGSLAAHYDRGGRDIWAKLTYQYGAQLSIQVADVGAEDWAAKLDRECHLPLYGVFFDFNKAGLKPESAPVLAKAAALLAGKPAIKAEIQGHTDNVGGDAYNQKLSEARALSVRQWLAAHGVDAARLTSKGFGKAQPVADNGTDEGRAKNRRVELTKVGCAR